VVYLAQSRLKWRILTSIPHSEWRTCNQWNAQPSGSYNPNLPEAEQNCLSAKQRRLSRPNNTEELRLKRGTRNKKLREKRHKESGNAKQRRLTNKIKSQIEIRPQHLSYDRGQCIILLEKVERRSFRTTID
jgi:hypothetical protein